MINKKNCFWKWQDSNYFLSCQAFVICQRPTAPINGTITLFVHVNKNTHKLPPSTWYLRPLNTLRQSSSSPQM